MFLEYMVGWFADPVFTGDYGATVKRIAGANLPAFTEEEKAMIKGSVDFMGLNYYSSRFVSYNASDVDPLFPGANYTEATHRNGQPIGPRAESEWLFAVPWGFRKLLNWVHQRYQADIYVTENGNLVWNPDTDRV